MGDGRFVAEPVHGSAPKYAGQDKVNPSAMILSGRIMLEHLGWEDASELIYDAIEEAVLDKRVTYDIERQLDDAERVGTSEFADFVIENIESNA